jgi:hypothetical protein
MAQGHPKSANGGEHQPLNGIAEGIFDWEERAFLINPSTASRLAPLNPSTLLPIQRTPYPAAVHSRRHMRIDLRGAHVLMTQQFLNGPQMLQIHNPLISCAFQNSLTFLLDKNPGFGQPSR